MEKLLSIGEVAEILGIPVRTLREWRMKGEGPRAGRYGRHLRYRPSEVERFQRERELQPASRAGDGAGQHA